MKIAPKEIIWKDFRKLQKEAELLTDPVVEDLLFMQTIEGHSHNGDGTFDGRRFVDTTLNDIVQALGRDIFVVRSERQMLIDEIYDFVNTILEDNSLNILVNKRGEPLMRVPLFLEERISGEDVLRGLYLGGLMDDFEVRKRVNDKFGTKLGGGKPYLIDMRVMEKIGLDGEMLAHGSYEDKLDEFRKIGLILEPSTVDLLAHQDIRFQYIRHKKGLGVSDDLALLVAGKLYNESVALGVYLADAIDTLDKFSLKFIEQDDVLADYIKRNMVNLNISDDEVYRFIKTIAIPEGMEDRIPDSSQRYFLEIQKDYKISTLESHLRYLKGLSTPAFKIAYERSLNIKLYEYIDKILKEL